MEHCPACGRPVDSLGNPLGDDVPGGGAGRSDAASAYRCSLGDASMDAEIPEGQPVARFTSAAEAGFFASELEHLAGIPVAVHISESFDAVVGCWQPGFVLRVPPHRADEAARLVQEWASQPDPREAAVQETARVAREPGPQAAWRRGRLPDRTVAGFDPASDDLPGETFTLEENMSWGVPWLPLLLTLTAGSLTVWTVRKLNRPPVRVAPARPAAEILQEQLKQRESLSGVWIRKDPQLELNLPDMPVDLVPARIPPVISIQTDRRGTLIRSDYDGDGRYDEEFVFPFGER